MVCLYRKQEVAFRDFHDELTTLMDRLMEKCSSILVGGDFNVWIDETGEKDADMLINLTSSYGLIQNVNEPTHRGGHTLDQVYSNPYQIEIKHTVLIEQLGLKTDHFPIVVYVPSGKVEKREQIIHCRKLKGVDLERFTEDLKKAVDTIDSICSFAEYNSVFVEQSRGIVDQYAPMISWKKKNGEPDWLDGEYEKQSTTS